MKVVHGISHWNERYLNPVVAIGVFDGLHHGHRRLIRKMQQRCQRIQGASIVVTFDPHPARRLHPKRNLPLIVSLDFRLKLLEEAGVQACLVVNFTNRFAQMRPEWFIDHYLINKLHVAEVVVGEDFRFGHQRRGNVALLKSAGLAKGFRVHEIPIRRTDGHKVISSTRIRRYLEDADIIHAQKMLERPVTIMGRVVQGDRRGGALGYPTANLDPLRTGMAPRGVYCVRVRFGLRCLYGMANVGVRPSFKKDTLPNIEVHIFDFHANLYSKEIVVEFLFKIRDEQVFPSSHELIAQLQSDEKFARAWFAAHPS